MKENSLTPLQNSDWYTELIEECKAILSEGHFAANLEILKTKWELGRRVEEEQKNFSRAGYGRKVIEILAKELDIADSSLWKCIQFYKKFPEKKFDNVICQLGDGKTPSWHKVCLEILPAHKEQEENQRCAHNNLLCLKCRKRFKRGEI